MKLNKLWASALALLALASCGRDLEPPVNTIQSEYPAKTQLVQMEIKASQGEDDAMRIGYGVSTGDNGALTGLAMAEKNLSLRIAVKQGINGTPVVRTYPFTKVPGASYATFSGKIEVPVKNGDDLYYMAAILVSEGEQGKDGYLEYATVGNDDATSVAIESSKNDRPLQPDTKNKIYPNIPYRSQWTEVTMNPEGTGVSRASLTLKPLGTLLRFRIHNTTQKPQDISHLYFAYSLFANAGEFDFTRTDDNQFPYFFTSSQRAVAYALPSSLKLNPNEKSAWYYIWVKGYSYNSDIRPHAPMEVLYKSSESAPYAVLPIFKTNEPLVDGSVAATFRIRSADDAQAEFEVPQDQGNWESHEPIYDWPGTVLRRLSTNVVSVAENTFVGDLLVRNPSVGYYTFAEAVQKFKEPLWMLVNGERRKYSLPTESEMRSIFPGPAEPVTPTLVQFWEQKDDILNILERGVSISDETFDFRGDYRYNPNKETVYAIRFKSASNKHRTAFRYTVQEGQDRNVRVQARFLGNNPEFKSITLDQVEQDSFWANPSTYDERCFPFYGSSNHRTDPVYQHTSTGAFWTSTARSSDHASELYIRKPYGHTDAILSNGSPAFKFPVFLFERK